MMTLPWYIVLYMVAIPVTVIIGVLAWRQRGNSGAVPFSLMMFGIGYWTLCAMFEHSAMLYDARVFWARAAYPAIMSVPLLWMLFALDYMGVWRPSLRDRRLWLLLIVPLVTVALAWTNDIHGLIWSSITPNTGTNQLVYEHGAAFWAASLFSYLCVFVGIFAIITGVRGPGSSARLRALVMLLAVVLVVAANLLYLTDVTPIDLTPLSMGAAGCIILVSMLGTEMFRMLPQARQRIVSLMREGIIIVNEQDVLIYANPSAMTLLSLGIRDLIGQPVHEALADYPELIACATGEKGISDIDLNGDGSHMLEAESRPINDEQQLRAGTLVLLRDVTLQKKSRYQSFELELEQERVGILTTFIRAAAHEFRTPLSVIKTSVYVAGRAEDPAARQAQYARIAFQMNRMNRLLDQVQTMVRLDAQAEFERVSINLNDIVRECVNRIRPEIETASVKLVMMLSRNLPAISGDAASMGRAIDELLTNAVHYTPTGGTITVTTEYAKEGLLMQVNDTGIGMSTQEQVHIFERLYRADSSRSRPGFGLGLSIAQRIIQGHDGSIVVESEPGKGSTFTVWLPIEEGTIPTPLSRVVTQGGTEVRVIDSTKGTTR
ncbi:MAG: PAS domain-containing protein [Pleurocapsa minor GSE-CHR-MK-17-07R]|jgi:signal transduction histidine kinase|nr:PAS domain-containing protein [Pleurocapsa minor GSE-CHR-MK 17-07R]